MTDKLMKREIGTDSANLLTSVIAVVSLHWENSSSVKSEVSLELSFMKDRNTSITKVIAIIKIFFMHVCTLGQ